MQPWQRGHNSLSPRVLCVGIALSEFLELMPHDERLADAARVIVEEAEKYQPDFIELTWAWDTALEILSGLAESCEAGALGLLLVEQLEGRPF